MFSSRRLYSSMSLADPENCKPHNQIARKLRVGVKEAKRAGKIFHFIILDVAPMELLLGLNPRASLAEASQKSGGNFSSKWQTAYWFRRYRGARGGVTPLREVLNDIGEVDVEAVARNMGWLTWADVYKVVLRAVINRAA